MGLDRLSELDAVTLDACGTLVELEDPLPSLRESLAAHGLVVDETAVRHGFEAEKEYYAEHVLEGDEAGLADLRRRCAAVFLEATGCELEPGSFVDDFQRALNFVPLPGVAGALRRLRAYGLDLAVVSNWDVDLPHHLKRAGLAHFFSAVVTSSGCGIRKPDPAIFALALDQLGVIPTRALHVGDQPKLDEAGATAAGLRFASAPLAPLL